MPSPVTGQVTVTTTAAPLTTDNTLAVVAFIVKASPSNAETIELVSSGGAVGDGFELSAGEFFAYERNTQAGQPRYDLRPCDIYVVGASGTVSWFASVEN